MKFFEKVFGVDQKKYESTFKEKPIDSGAIQYMGGHKAFPQPIWTRIYFYEDRFEIDDYKIAVPYSKIKDISNSNERKRHEDWLALGIVGFVGWKRNAIYTIIEYDDGVDTQKIVIDFRNNANYAQAMIYKKMLECRKNSEQQKKEGGSSDASKSSNSSSPTKF